MTLSKAFGLPRNKVLGESGQFEIRANAYNIDNRLNLAGVGATGGGSINDSIGTRNADGTFTSNAAFGQTTSALGSRTVEVQGRFSF